MTLQIQRSVRQLFEEAMREVETWTVEQAREALGKPGVTFIDLRDPREIWRDDLRDVRRLERRGGTRRTGTPGFWANSLSRRRP